MSTQEEKYLSSVLILFQNRNSLGLTSEYVRPLNMCFQMLPPQYHSRDNYL